MNKLDEFKKFIATIPSIKTDVLNGRYTWQQLYETYVLYGPEDKFWLAYKQSNTLDLGQILSFIKSIDVQALTTSLESIEKVLTMASSFLTKDEPKENNKQKWYNE